MLAMQIELHISVVSFLSVYYLLMYTVCLEFCSSFS